MQCFADATAETVAMQGAGFGNAQISIWAFAVPLLCNGADLLSPGFLVSRKADAGRGI